MPAAVARCPLLTLLYCVPQNPPTTGVAPKWALFLLSQKMPAGVLKAGNRDALEESGTRPLPDKSAPLPGKRETRDRKRKSR